MPEGAFDGFDHTRYEQDATDRWGPRGLRDRWWRSLSVQDKAAFGRRQLDIAADFGRAQLAGLPADSDQVQAIARREVEWLSVNVSATKAYVVGPGEMYVTDPRFTANYDRHGVGTATLVRDALTVCAERHLE